MFINTRVLGWWCPTDLHTMSLLLHVWETCGVISTTTSTIVVLDQLTCNVEASFRS